MRHFKALALAKLGYVRALFEHRDQLHCKALCSIVETDAEPSASGGLRKDYAYLFARFFYYLEDRSRAGEKHGVIVFDELDKTKSHLLIDQAHVYFKETATGRRRASLILREPFSVHSDLTTGVRIADLIAYTVSWGLWLPTMRKPDRRELHQFAQQVLRLRTRFYRERNGNPNFEIWGFQSAKRPFDAQASRVLRRKRPFGIWRTGRTKGARRRSGAREGVAARARLSP